MPYKIVNLRNRDTALWLAQSLAKSDQYFHGLLEYHISACILAPEEAGFDSEILRWSG
ncbi:hypothetical protein D3C73_1006280 [compost metagenome]